jgi:tRNA A37 N6-isopentenylltransferase MiaA
MAGETGWDETVAAITKATCHLAKRQLTWFRKMAHVHWFNLSVLDERTAVATLVQHLQAALDERKGWESGVQSVDAVVEG